MKRPIESDYISQVAYTRALEVYCDWLTQRSSSATPRTWVHATEWRGLTDEEAKQIREEANQHFKPEETRQKIVQELVEAKLKEKNT